jgi:hypothetical protein
MLVLTGLQGVGVKTFLQRSLARGVPTQNIFDFEYPTLNESYERPLGPSRTTTDLMGEAEAHAELDAEFSREYVAMLQPNNQLAYEKMYDRPFFKVCNFPCPGTTVHIQNTFPDHDNTYVLITAPRETQIERLVAQYSESDPRIAGKSNYMYLVKPEIEKELDAREKFIDQLRDTVDYHIHNDGDINQYYAAIDQVLNEENLLS